jgi:hypothetical protein
MTNPTDLAARFEAKREECVERAERLWAAGQRTDDWGRGRATAFAEARDMARADAAGGAGERVRHLKRGTEYEVLGEAEAQVATGHRDIDDMTYTDIQDGSRLTVYRCLKTGKLWTRLTDEFRDGRFETIAAPPPPAQQGSSSPLREGETVGASPSGSGYSGSAPSPMVSASGEYPSRGQAAMIKRLTKEYRRRDWSSMSEPGKHFAKNLMTDALRKSGLGLVALGIEARQGRDEGSVEDESPADVSATPTPDPRKEALAVLEGLPKWLGPQQFIEVCRKTGDHKQADRFEAALATLSATDQAGEVRDV